MGDDSSHVTVMRFNERPAAHKDSALVYRVMLT